MKEKNLINSYKGEVNSLIASFSTALLNINDRENESQQELANQLVASLNGALRNITASFAESFHNIGNGKEPVFVENIKVYREEIQNKIKRVNAIATFQKIASQKTASFSSIFLQLGTGKNTAEAKSKAISSISSAFNELTASLSNTLKSIFRS